MTGIQPAKKGEEEGTEVVREPSDEAPFAALAFKVMSDPFVGKLAFFRVYSGKLVQGTSVYNSTRQKTERVSRISQMHADKREDIGEVGAVTALVEGFYERLDMVMIIPPVTLPGQR